MSSAEMTILGGKASLKAPYSTSNPFMKTQASILCDSITEITAVTEQSPGDEIRFVINKDGGNYFWNGTEWIDADGTYAQSNTVADINTNISTLITEKCRVRFNIYFHSYDGSTTPTIDLLNINYVFNGYSTAEDVRARLVNVSASVITDEQIMARIDEADRIIDFYLGSKYTVPFTSPVATINMFSYKISAYLIYKYFETKDGQDLGGLSIVDYKETIKMLKSISQGDGGIPGLTQVDVITCTSSKYAPTFNMLPFDEQRVDPVLLNDEYNDTYF